MAVPLPRDLAQRPFTVREALSRGVSPKQLRSSRLWTPYRGVRVAADLGRDLPVRCAALALLLPAALFDGRTAARLMDLPVPGADEPLVVQVPAGSPAPAHAGVRAHRDGHGDRPSAQLTNGLRIVGAPEMWRRLVSDASLTVDDLVVVADAVRQRWPRADLPGAAPRGTTARARHAEAIAMSRAGAKSPQETRLRLVVVRGGVPEPQLNVEIRGADGQWLAEGDLVWPEGKVVAEYDSERHRVSARQWERDIWRRRNLEDEGWIVEVITAHDLCDGGHRALQRITAALHRAGATW